MRFGRISVVAAVAASIVAVAGCSSSVSTSNAEVDRSAAPPAAAAVPTDQEGLANFLKQSELNCESGDTKWQKAAGAELFSQPESGDPYRWPTTRVDAAGTQAVGLILDPASKVYGADGEPVAVPSFGGGKGISLCRVKGADATFAVGRTEPVKVLKHVETGKCVVLKTDTAPVARMATLEPCDSVPANEVASRMAASIRTAGHPQKNEIRIGDRCTQYWEDGSSLVPGRPTPAIFPTNCALMQSWFNVVDDQIVHESFGNQVCLEGVSFKDSVRREREFWYELYEKTKDRNVEDYARGIPRKYPVSNLWFSAPKKGGCGSAENRKFVFQDYKYVTVGDLTVPVGETLTAGVSSAMQSTCTSHGKDATVACLSRVAVPAAGDGALRAGLAAVSVWNLPVRVAMANASGSPIGVGTGDGFDASKTASAKVGSQSSGAVLMAPVKTQLLALDESTASSGTSPAFARVVASGESVKVADSVVTLRISTTTGDEAAAKQCAASGAFKPEVSGVECGFVDVKVEVPGGAAGADSVSAIKWGCRAGGIAETGDDYAQRFVEVSVDKQAGTDPKSLTVGGYLPLKVTIHDVNSRPRAAKECDLADADDGSISLKTLKIS